MSDRRRLLLMAALNNGVWLPYSYEYLYHDLIPTDINGGEVKNKARVSKIYANGVVENQLVENGNFEDTTNWSGINGTLSTSNNILSYTITAIGGDYGSNRIVQLYTHIANHYYLIDIWVKTPYATMVRAYIDNFIELGTTVANQWTRLTKLYKPTSSGGTHNIYFDVHGQASYQVGDVIQVKAYQKIDLTQMFPFDTPTTLTDKRVQNILARGYIPYNTGTYKGTDIGEISSTSKNLCEHETLTAYSYSDDYLHFNSNNAIRLKAGTYTFSCIPTTPEGATSSQIYVQAFDKDNINNQFVFSDIATYSVGAIVWDKALYTRPIFTLTLKQECYITICGKASVGILTKPQMEIGSVATSYTTYKSFTPITFKYQGNGAGTSHDSWEITKTEHVFTKNNGIVDLGTLSWSYQSDNSRFISDSLTGKLSSIPSGLVKGNLLCNKYTTIKYDDSVNANNVIYQYTTQPTYNRIMVKDSSLNGDTSLITGTLYYELATPQVIRIPRKHLGIVDLGSLNWNKETYTYNGNSYYRFKVQISGIKIITSTSTIHNIYCEKYMTDTAGHSFQQTSDKIIALDTNSFIVANDSSYNDATTFKNSLQGIYLFYETENEVADINNIVDIESGGTITSYLYTWYLNQHVVNGDFATQTNWQFYNFSSASWSASDNTATITVSSYSGSATYGQFYQNIAVVANHTYLLLYDIKSDSNNNANWRLGGESNINISTNVTTTSWNTVYCLKKRTDTASDFGLYLSVNGGTTLPATFYLRNVRYIDLTLAFGSGNEPTSINDPRIQYIINQGYIPTNTTGTYKLVNCEVLPNVDFEYKCK